jgi:hypothetical protein
MSQHLQETPGLTIARTRVYFDPETGEIVHVHRIASAGPLTAAQVDEELDAFAESIEARHGRTLDSVDVDESELLASVSPDVSLKVDVSGRRVVRDS